MEDASAPDPAERGAWAPGTIVSVYRSGLDDAFGAVVGIGRLVDRLEVGERFRIQLSDADAIEPSAVSELRRIDPRTLEVRTAHARYELRRIDGAPPRAAASFVPQPADADDTTGRRLELTGQIQLDVAPTARPGVFEEGAAVEVRKPATAGGPGEIGVLLGDLDPGEPLRISMPHGVISTSAIDRVVEKEAGRVVVFTSNSTYLLILAEPDPR